MGTGTTMDVKKRWKNNFKKTLKKRKNRYEK
jgi:hypothetical protein